MNHSRTGARAKKNGALKTYVTAVLIGFLLGSVYAVAEQPPESQAQIPSPKQPAVQQSHIMKSLRTGDDCGARVDIRPASVVVAPPMPIFEGAADHYVEVGPADVRKAVCTWAI